MLESYVFGLVILLFSYGIFCGVNRSAIYLWNILFIAIWPVSVVVIICLFIVSLGSRIGRFIADKLEAKDA